MPSPLPPLAQATAQGRLSDSLPAVTQAGPYPPGQTEDCWGKGPSHLQHLSIPRGTLHSAQVPELGPNFGHPEILLLRPWQSWWRGVGMARRGSGSL